MPAAPHFEANTWQTTAAIDERSIRGSSRNQFFQIDFHTAPVRAFVLSWVTTKLTNKVGTPSPSLASCARILDGKIRGHDEERGGADSEYLKSVSAGLPRSVEYHLVLPPQPFKEGGAGFSLPIRAKLGPCNLANTALTVDRIEES